MKGFFFASPEEACEWHEFDDEPTDSEEYAEPDKFGEWYLWRREWSAQGEPELMLA